MHQLQRSWVRSQHPSAQGNLRAADEEVLNEVQKKIKCVKRWGRGALCIRKKWIIEDPTIKKQEKIHKFQVKKPIQTMVTY